MSTILKITNLVKYYSSDEPVIKRLSLEVKKGEVFGFIGPNGAGKSTTIKCITGILPFEEGEITINNLDILQEPLDAKRSFGYVADNQAVYEEMTGREFVEFIASVYGLKENFKHLFEELVKRFNMSHAIDQYISNYSHGMKQKVCIIASLINEPDLWILDEPLTGLDISSAMQLKNTIIDYKKKGKSVLLTSHNIDSVEKLCDRVAIIIKGEIKTIIDMKDFNGQSLEKLFYQLVQTSEGVE